MSPRWLRFALFHSLAWRLTAWYALSSFALVLLIATISYYALLNAFSRETDGFLSDSAKQLRNTINQGPEAEQVLQKEVEEELPTRLYLRKYARVLNENGSVRFETKGMSRTLPASIFPVPDTDDVPRISELLLEPRARTFRSITVRTGGPHPKIIQVACDTEREAGILKRYKGYLVLVLSLSFILCAIGGYAIVRRGIRPLAQITSAAGQIGHPTIHERIRIRGLPAELNQLAASFNEMLDRLEDSFDRVSQFSEDIAHELRTPVNNLRGGMEVVLGKPRSVEEYRDALGSALEECERLGRLVDRLLFIARSENTGGQLEREAVLLRDELARTCEFFGATAEESGIDLRYEAEADLAVAANRDLLRSLVGNLVSNSLAHTPRGGSVTLRARREAEGVAISVADTGRGIPPEHVPHIFERFYRVDRSRTKNLGGVGLGLAIVQSIAKMHAAHMEVESRLGTGTTITAHFQADARMKEPRT